MAEVTTPIAQIRKLKPNREVSDFSKKSSTEPELGLNLLASSPVPWLLPVHQADPNLNEKKWLSFSPALHYLCWGLAESFLF